MSNPITQIMCLVFGTANAFGSVAAIKFAVTGTNPDPAKAREDGPKTIGGRAASLFVGIVMGFTALCAVQVLFLGRIAWLPFF